MNKERNLIIGILKELFVDEKRVSIVPDGVKFLIENRFTAYVETGAGLSSGFSDLEYLTAGAFVLPRHEVISKATFFPKIKQLTGELTRFSENETKELEDFLNIIVQSPSEAPQSSVSRKYVFSFIAPEHITSNDIKLYQQWSTKMLRIDAEKHRPLLAVMSRVAGEEMIRIGLGEYRSCHENRHPERVHIVGAGSVAIGALRKLKELDSTIRITVYCRNTEKAIRHFENQKQDHGKISFEPLDSLGKQVKEIDFLIMALVDRVEGEDYLLDQDQIAGMAENSIIMECEPEGCTWLKGLEHVTSHKAPFIQIGENKVRGCFIPNYPAAMPRSTSIEASEKYISFILKAEEMKERGEELPIVRIE